MERKMSDLMFTIFTIQEINLTLDEKINNYSVDVICDNVPFLCTVVSRC